MKGKRKGERRYWGERRSFLYTAYSVNRRSGKDRRLFDRRNLTFEKE